jgi:glycosyltransferase involved in cell wall biosynthesis
MGTAATTTTTTTTTVSIVVPTRDSGRTIAACLRSCRTQRTSPDVRVELIVVDNHSSDATATIAARYADLVLTAGPERSAQRNLGLGAATGGIVGFVDSDMVLSAGVVAAVARLLGADRQLGGAVVPELSVGEGYLAGCRALEKRLYVGDPDVEAARFFRTDVVRSVGGYREDLRAGEDWDLADRLEAAGHRMGRIDVPIRHDDGRISLRQTFRKKRYYGRSFADYLDTRTPGRRRRLSRPALLAHPVALARDPVHAGGLVVLKAVEAGGLALGVLDARRHRR